jgi:hypothetical protein
VLEGLSVQMQRLSLFFDDQGRHISGYSNRAIRVPFPPLFNRGGPLRLKLLRVYIPMFEVSFDPDTRGAAFVNDSITDPTVSIEVVRCLCEMGLIRWSEPIDETGVSRGQWIWRAVRAFADIKDEDLNDTQKKLRSMWNLTQAPRIRILASARHPRLGANATQVARLPDTVLQNVQKFS